MIPIAFLSIYIDLCANSESFLLICLQVAIFLLLGIVLSGAALGYWIVRKFVISEDGNVDVGVAQFVKWAMRIIGATSIFQVCQCFCVFGFVPYLNFELRISRRKRGNH